MSLEARLEGPTISVGDLLTLTEGNLLVFDYPVERSVELLVNGARKFTAQMVGTGKRRGCAIENVRVVAAQGKMSGDGPGSGEGSRSE